MNLTKATGTRYSLLIIMLIKGLIEDRVRLRFLGE